MRTVDLWIGRKKDSKNLALYIGRNLKVANNLKFSLM
jgi:hypothetical protein